MPSLCQADWETRSQEGENDCQMLEEKEASGMGDGGGEETAEGETDQEGDKKDGGGLGGGAASPSLPTPIELFSTPDGAEELQVWGPQPYEKQIAFLTTLLVEREAQFKRQKTSAEEFELIGPYWVNYMVTQMKKRFEQTPEQKEKIAHDVKQGMTCKRKLNRRKGRFTAMLNHHYGIPKGDARGPPPTKKIPRRIKAARR